MITMFGFLLWTVYLLLGSGICGICVGVIMFIAGGQGISLYKDHQNIIKARLYLASSIVSCCLSVIGIITYAEAMDSLAKYVQFI